jgi:hypothetical protein
MFSYTGRRHKKKFLRNKCSKFLLMSFLKFFNCRKRHVAMQKKRLKKWANVQDIENNGYSDARHEKKREKKKKRKRKKR